jgi:hypothetical protein
LGEVQAGLGGVVAIVERNGEDLARPGNRRPELGIRERDRRPAPRCSRRPVDELLPSTVDPLGVGVEPAVAGPLDVDGTLLGEEGEPAGQVSDAHVCSLGSPPGRWRNSA